jgi:hypothetical protein
MRVLTACEFSGRVRNAFTARGHEAWSCDLLDSESPGNHIKGDVLQFLNAGWDMMIAFPPCTYLSSASGGYYDCSDKQDKALTFVLELLNAPIKKIALENPTGAINTQIDKPDQIIHPYQFGDPYYKRTCLWLKGLPKLLPTNPVEAIDHWVNGSNKGPGRNGVAHNAKERSLTFPGIADAMADQWGGTIGPAWLAGF